MTGATSISTHVLDTALGKPASGIPVTFSRVDSGGQATTISQDVTNADGRVAGLVPKGGAIDAGSYRLTFDVAGYFAAAQRRAFYRTIHIDVEIGIEPQHYHVPLLLSPFGYSTYRGS